MVQYKFHYFNARGLGEPIRYILAYANADWVDERIPMSGPPAVLPEELKKNSMFGQAPLLEFEGQFLSQSLAICRFLGRRFNLNGANELEAARIEEVGEGLRDFMQGFVRVFAEQDETKKKELLETATTAATTKFLPIFSSVLEKNGGQQVVGGSVSWADFILVLMPFQFEKVFGVDLIGGFPTLKAHRERINALPGVKEYVAKRPETLY